MNAKAGVAEAARYLQSASVSCIRLPGTRDGKEGVDGSSPSEGSPESPASAGLLHSQPAALRPACSGMEQLLEQPEEKRSDFVAYRGVNAGRVARVVRSSTAAAPARV